MNSSELRRGFFVAATMAAAGIAVILWSSHDPTEKQLLPLETRGGLFDARGQSLTRIEDRWQTALNIAASRRLEPQEAMRFSHELASRLGLEAERVQYLVERGQGDERYVGPRLTAEETRAINEWMAASRWKEHPELLRFIRAPVRTYPAGETMAPVLGFVGVDGYGLEGLELKMDAALKRGANIRLSIAAENQRAVANMLNEALQRYGAEDAAATVIDLPTHSVLAMVSLPSFNPNDINERIGRNVRLRPAIDLFQAGPLLQPFLLSGVLSAQPPEANALNDAFIAGRGDAGIRMAQALGLDAAKNALTQAGFAEPTRIEFPSETLAQFRRQGPDPVLLNEIGEGAAVAPTLIRYAASLTALLNGSPMHEVRMVIPDSPRPGQQAATAVAAEDSHPEVANRLREQMVARARSLTCDPQADFGGIWSSYKERAEGHEAARNIVAALFMPADQPRYLVVLKIRAGANDPGANAGLQVGTDILHGITTAKGQPGQQFSAQR